MIRSKKKGFTLVELLGVIVILLLLALVVTPIFINYIKRSKDDAYDTQINTIKQSAKSWASAKENINLLPTKNGDCISVTLERLKDDGYVDYNIKNPNTDTLFSDDMRVVIRKDGKKLVYEIDEDGTESCSLITSEYPKWVLESASPAKVSSSSTANIVIKSDKKILNQQLTREKITVKVGGKNISDANVEINCSNDQLLTCNLAITNLSGSGKLGLVIDKETMQDEDGNFSKKQNISPNIMVDCEGPIITYLSKTNTNKRTKYATKNDTIKIKFKAEDNEVISNLNTEDIIVYLTSEGQTVGTEVSCNKTLTSKNSAGKIEYTLTLKNITGNGKLSINIPAGKIEDDLGNKNTQKSIAPGITYDNIAPGITFNPDERSQYLSNINVLVNAFDNETGVDEKTLKYSFVKDPQNATATKKIVNGTIVNKDGENEQKEIWYIVATVCDMAGNCTSSNAIGGPYNLSRKGPEITITPTGTNSYVKNQNITIAVTPSGIDLDETTFKYTYYDAQVSLTDKSPEVDTIYENNKSFTLKGLNGSYYIVAEACDVQGNCTRKAVGPYSFDNEAPNMSCKLKSHPATVKGPYGVSVWIRDYGIGLNSQKYKIYPEGDSSGSYVNFPVNQSGFVNSWVFIPGDSTKTKRFYIEVKACDGLNNCRTKSCGPYRIDVISPEITGFTKNDSNYSFTATIKDDNWLGGYKVTSSSQTPEDGWIEATGTTKQISSYNVGQAGTYYLHVKDYVGNTTYKKFTLATQEEQKKQVIVSDDVTTCTKQTYTFTAKYDGYYRITMKSARSEDGIYNYNIGTTIGNHDNDLEPSIYSRPKETYGSTGSGIYYFSKNQELRYKLGCSGTDGTTYAPDIKQNMNIKDQPGTGGWPDGADGAADTGASGSAGSVILQRKNENNNWVTVMRIPGGAGGIRINQLTEANFAKTFSNVYTFNDAQEYYNGSFNVELNNVQDRKVGWIKIEYLGDYLTSSVGPWDFELINGTQVFVAPKSGLYKLEVWGAQGGDDFFTTGGSSATGTGGKGGYSTVTVSLIGGGVSGVLGQPLFITVGSQPSKSYNYQANANEAVTRFSSPGGFNGGGYGANGGASGGGATFITTTYNSNGLLMNYTSNKNDILVVAGGGGGGIVNSMHTCPGGAGGGANGKDGFESMSSSSQCSASSQYRGRGGTSAGSPAYSDELKGGFGLGGTGYGSGAGGGGYYGGSGGYGSSVSGGGGSGYISSDGAEDQYTYDGTMQFKDPDGTTVTGHAGNGYARITYLGPNPDW